MELLPALNKAELKRSVPLHRTVGQTTGWPPWLFRRSAIPDLHVNRVGAALGRVAAPVQGHPWGRGGAHPLLQLVQPLLDVTAAPAVHPPPLRLAGALREVPQIEAEVASQAHLLLRGRCLRSIWGPCNSCLAALNRSDLQSGSQMSH